jgi:glutamate synthase domain-containing protein 3
MELSVLSHRLLADALPAIESGTPVDLAYPISNVDRTIGARLSGEVVARHGTASLPEGTIKVRLSGTAGQSFGAWLTAGIELRLAGTANDYVGKGMGGGLLVGVPRRGPRTPHAGGNAVLYGATGGRAYLAGSVGQRFAVRNSGASVVVEGCSDHGCEYMTGGTAVVLGPVGRNFGAGMTGGVAYVWDPAAVLNRFVADTSPAMRRLLDMERVELRSLVSEHAMQTKSPVASDILSDWDRQVERFWVLRASRPVHSPSPEPLTLATAGI